MTITIPLTKGYSAIVDDEDSDLADFHWAALIGNSTEYGFRNTGKGKTAQHYYMHRVILERVLNCKLERHELVDHIDGNGLNNRRENLRLATYTQNVQNKRIQKNNRSGYKGVCWDKSTDKWKAQIMFNKKQRYLGSFDTPEAAHQSYCEAAQELFGEFARKA